MKLTDLKSITTLYVYKNQTLVGELNRTKHGAEFSYYIREDIDSKRTEYLDTQSISFLMPRKEERYQIKGDNLHTFFAGILPEGRRLEVLYDTIKTSKDDLFSLLATTGQDVIGDISVSIEKKSRLNHKKEQSIALEKVIFEELFEASIFETSLDKKLNDSSIPGVYPKISAELISFPVTLKKRNVGYILKLETKKFPNLISNEHFFMKMASDCGIDTASTKIVYDKENNPGLLVQRFDRYYDKSNKLVLKLHQEDSCQFLDYYPADKYRLSMREIAEGIEKFSTAPIIEITKLIKQTIFSYIIGNGDMHGKNISLGCDAFNQKICLTPAYDLISTVPYGDEEMALHIEGKKSNIRKKDFIAFGERSGVPKAAIINMIRTLLSNISPWISRYEEIGFSNKKTKYLKNFSIKRAKELE